MQFQLIHVRNKHVWALHFNPYFNVYNFHNDSLLQLKWFYNFVAAPSISSAGSFQSALSNLPSGSNSLTNVASAGNGAPNTLANAAGGAYNALAGAAGGAYNALAGAAGGAYNALAGVAGGAYNAAAGVANAAVNTAATVANVANGIQQVRPVYQAGKAVAGAAHKSDKLNADGSNDQAALRQANQEKTNGVGRLGHALETLGNNMAPQNQPPARPGRRQRMRNGFSRVKNRVKNTVRRGGRGRRWGPNYQ
jgi:hypothetical protein